MPSNTLFFGWNRPLPGRERLSAAHFDDLVAHLEGLQKEGAIAGYDVVLLEPHGGDLNGFFLIRGDAAQLDALVASEAWSDHMVRALMHLEGHGHVRGYTGDAVPQRMQSWSSHIPD